MAVVVVLAGESALLRWGGPVVAFFRDQDRIRAWISDFGSLAPLISILLNAIQVLLAPVPGQVVALANGYLFGVVWGTVYSLVGVTLGSALAMGLGRWLGRPLVERLVKAEKLDRWDDLAHRYGAVFPFGSFSCRWCPTISPVLPSVSAPCRFLLF